MYCQLGAPATVVVPVPVVGNVVSDYVVAFVLMCHHSLQQRCGSDCIAYQKQDRCTVACTVMTGQTFDQVTTVD